MTTTTPAGARLAERLGQIDPDYLTDEYRRQLAESVRVQHFNESAKAAVVVAEKAVTSALADRDLAAANSAAHRLATAQLVAERLPTARIDQSLPTEALNKARHALTQAAAGLDVNPIDYQNEREQWRRLPSQVKDRVDGPAPLPTDLETVKERERVVRLVEDMAASLATWREDTARNGVDVLAMLAAATSYMKQLAELREVVEKFNAQAERANNARSEAGLTWRAPSFAGAAC